MTSIAPPASAPELVLWMRQTIPLAAAMGLELAAHDADSLSLRLPLAPNINDKGCAFGGSLASAMTLAGWALVNQILQQHALHGDIFVATSSIRYLQPVWADCVAEARLEVPDERSRSVDSFIRRGRARFAIVAQIVLADGQIAASLHGGYAAVRAE